MPESRYDVRVESWSCLVTNQHRKAFGGRKIRQRTVIRLTGTVDGTDDPAGVYLTFERGAQGYDPTITATDAPDERIRIDAFFVHGQEAAALAVLQSGHRVWARFSENAVGQAAFTLESGPDLGPALALPPQ
ncbi:MAG: hypothetical protein AB7U83_08695 [Vicinamibacterales bacterium]